MYIRPIPTDVRHNPPIVIIEQPCLHLSHEGLEFVLISLECLVETILSIFASTILANLAGEDVRAEQTGRRSVTTSGRGTSQ